MCKNIEANYNPRGSHLFYEIYTCVFLTHMFYHTILCVHQKEVILSSINDDKTRV